MEKLVICIRDITTLVIIFLTSNYIVCLVQKLEKIKNEIEKVVKQCAAVLIR